MSAFTEMADRYEEVEAENEQLYMQVRRLKAENADLLAALEDIAMSGMDYMRQQRADGTTLSNSHRRDAEDLREIARAALPSCDRLREERDDLLAGMKSLQHLFSQRRSARSMVELAQQCVDLRVAKTEEGE